MFLTGDKKKTSNWQKIQDQLDEVDFSPSLEIAGNTLQESAGHSVTWVAVLVCNAKAN